MFASALNIQFNSPEVMCTQPYVHKYVENISMRGIKLAKNTITHP